MNRSIKFRLRDERNRLVGYEKWYAGEFNSESRQDYYAAVPQWLYSIDDGKTWNPNVISHRHKDQFTGLLDKNGKEIYEGDLLKSKKTTIRVQWSDRAYGDAVGFGAVGADGDNEYNIHHFCAYGEIIGNIYENPELIK